MSPRAASAPRRSRSATEIFEIEFDFIAHRLAARTSRGEERSLPLEPQTGRRFLSRELFELLGSMGIDVADQRDAERDPERDPLLARTAPTPPTTPTRASLLARADAGGSRLQAVPHRLPRQGQPGAFLLGQLRSRGDPLLRPPAPLHPGGVPDLPDAVAREAYSHEVSSAGFWPGSEAFPHAAFYAYAYPEPPGFRDRPVTPGRRFRRDARRIHPALRGGRAAPAIPTRCCSTSCRPPMPPPPTRPLGPRRAGMPDRRRRAGASPLTVPAALA